MSISAQCPDCRTTFRAEDSLSGKRVKCPKCSTAILLSNARTMAGPPAHAPLPLETSVVVKQSPVARPHQGAMARIWRGQKGRTRIVVATVAGVGLLCLIVLGIWLGGKSGAQPQDSIKGGGDDAKAVKSKVSSGTRSQSIVIGSKDTTTFRISAAGWWRGKLYPYGSHVADAAKFMKPGRESCNVVLKVENVGPRVAFMRGGWVGEFRTSKQTFYGWTVQPLGTSCALAVPDYFFSTWNPRDNPQDKGTDYWDEIKKFELSELEPGETGYVFISGEVPTGETIEALVVMEDWRELVARKDSPETSSSLDLSQTLARVPSPTRPTASVLP